MQMYWFLYTLKNLEQGTNNILGGGCFTVSHPRDPLQGGSGGFTLKYYHSQYGLMGVKTNVERLLNHRTRRIGFVLVRLRFTGGTMIRLTVGE